MKLSIIIPYYNKEPYTSELLDALDPQIRGRDDVECVLVDDGSKKAFKTPYKWCKVIRQENRGCSHSRNVGLDSTSGEYVQFIDADDMVPEYFIDRLLLKIEESKADVIDFSWKSLNSEGAQHNYQLKSDNEHLSNPSVCTRALKRSFIGNTRFSEKKDSTEDEDFSRKLGILFRNDIKKVSIPEYMYFYRTAVENSKIKLFKQGLMKTKRIVYYYDHVKANMSDLFNEIKEDDKENEVILLTNRCDMPGLYYYCQIMKPCHLWSHYLKGQPYSLCDIIPVPVVADVVMYCSYGAKIGGIETFFYEWCSVMKEHYKILFLYDYCDPVQLERLKTVVQCVSVKEARNITCDTLILNRLNEGIPGNVSYKKTVQVCHCCAQKSYRIPQHRDYLVNVSKAAKASWGDEAKKGIVINNICRKSAKKSLLLISATRIGATDKGSNDSRFLKLAHMLNDAEIPFIWLNFSDVPLNNPPRNFVNLDSRFNIQDYIARADYLVQLSDVEAYSYAVLEALINHTAVICTPVPSFSDQRVRDGVNGYIVPYDMNFDVHKLLKVPQFEYRHDNAKIVKQWKRILDAKPPARKARKMVTVKILFEYYDIEQQREMTIGNYESMTEERAKYLQGLGYVRIRGG